MVVNLSLLPIHLPPKEYFPVGLVSETSGIVWISPVAAVPSFTFPYSDRDILYSALQTHTNND